jgi:hypothetical protein
MTGFKFSLSSYHSNIEAILLSQTCANDLVAVFELLAWKLNIIYEQKVTFRDCKMIT